MKPGYGQGLGVLAPASNPYSKPNPPAPAYRPQPQPQPTYSPPATPSFGIGAPDSGGMGGAPQPEPQAQPVMSEGDWLSGDGEYQNQMTEYDNSLKDFLARLTTQQNDFTADYNTAARGLGQNRERGLQQVGEDFTSRGLANSGLFNHSRDEAVQQFDQQKSGLDSAKSRALSDFGNQRTDKTKATNQAKGNARLASLGRMSMNQQF